MWLTWQKSNIPSKVSIYYYQPLALSYLNNSCVNPLEVKACNVFNSAQLATHLTECIIFHSHPPIRLGRLDHGMLRTVFPFHVNKQTNLELCITANPQRISSPYGDLTVTPLNNIYHRIISSGPQTSTLILEIKCPYCLPPPRVCLFEMQFFVQQHVCASAAVTQL